jgi:hypothetical protein
MRRRDVAKHDGVVARRDHFDDDRGDMAESALQQRSLVRPVGNPDIVVGA